MIQGGKRTYEEVKTSIFIDFMHLQNTLVMLLYLEIGTSLHELDVDTCSFQGYDTYTSQACEISSAGELIEPSAYGYC